MLILIIRTKKLLMWVLKTGEIVQLHCKYLNAGFECNDIVIFIYSHYPLDLNAISSDTKGSIKKFYI